MVTKRFPISSHVLWLFSVGLALGISLSVARIGPGAGDLGPTFREPGIGRERAVILVVSSRCVWCYQPNLVSAWFAIVDRTVANVPSTIDRVVTAAIVEAGNPREGFEYVSRFGDFHEITLGRAQNAAALRYVIDEFRGPRSTPQVLIVDREFATREDGSIYRKSEEMMQRLVGLGTILQAAGLPIEITVE